MLRWPLITALATYAPTAAIPIASVAVLLKLAPRAAGRGPSRDEAATPPLRGPLGATPRSRWPRAGSILLVWSRCDRTGGRCRWGDRRGAGSRSSPRQRRRRG